MTNEWRYGYTKLFVLTLKLLLVLTYSSLSAHRTEVFADLVLLACHESALLLLVEQLVALDVAQVAHVADVSERKVVVEASLTSPVADTLLHNHLLLLVALLVAVHGAVLVLSVLDLDAFLSHLLRLWLSSENSHHMLRLALNIFHVLEFFAPKARFSAFKVVVLALVALPATIGEVKVIDWFSLRGLLRGRDSLRIEGLLVKRSDSTG